MNIKDMVFAIIIALMITGGMQYFMSSYITPPASTDAPTFVAVKNELVQKPLNTEIHFIDIKKATKEVETTVDTQWGRLIFSNHGALLSSIDYKRVGQEEHESLRALFPAGQAEKQKGCFILAFDIAAPYYYNITQEEIDGTQNIITYQASFEGITVEKTFIVDTIKPVVDLIINIKMDNPAVEPIQPRIFFMSPYLPYLADGDIVSSLVIDNVGTFSKKSMSGLEESRGWLTPQLFGMDDRYFVHALFKDENNFTQRAYYKLSSTKELTGVLESKPVNSSTTWKLSFYCGPKDADILSLVDQRLEKSLDYYGWLAPISKGLLKILKWLYNYFHNYGIAIIMLTLLMKLFLLPFNFHGEKNMRRQKEMQKQQAYLQRKYADNPQQFALENQELLKKQGISILGGCLPLLLQVPIFFALNKLLANAIELYQAPFFWITDLSSKDPYYVFPFFVCVGLLINALVGDPKMRMTFIFMAFVFAALSANLSAGLALYLCVNSGLSMLQTYVLKLFHRENA